MFGFRTLLGGVAGVILLGFALQLVPYGRDHANPPVRGEPTWSSPQTRDLFTRACGDCHSNQTVWPWYSEIAPMSWLVQRDVDEGRRQLNVSEWPGGSGEANDAATTVREGEMPPAAYLLLHSDARLAAADRQVLIDGLTSTFGTERGGRRGSRRGG